jgi:hypothetical protein
MFVHVLFMFPETAGKPLEEVTAIFEDPNGPRYIGTPAWKTKNTWSKTSKFERGDLSDDDFAKHEKGFPRASVGSAGSPDRNGEMKKDAV